MGSPPDMAPPPPPTNSGPVKISQSGPFMMPIQGKVEFFQVAFMDGSKAVFNSKTGERSYDHGSELEKQRIEMEEAMKEVESIAPWWKE